MNAEVLFFFRDHMDALPLYERLESLILEQVPDVRIKVSKTQIGFSNRYGFAYTSFLPVRKAKDRPKVFLTITFGLFCRVDSLRIDAVSKPYPDRWTHHVMVSAPEEIDEELMGWIRAAAVFSDSKKSRKHHQTGGLTMSHKAITGMGFSKIYPLLIAKAEKKGRSRREVDIVTCWLTGYTPEDLNRFLEDDVPYGTFFECAPHLNENRVLIKGSVCGVKLAEIEDPLMREIRYLDKLVDELAKGKALENILRK